MSSIRIDLHQSAINVFLRSPAGEIFRAVREIGRRVENTAKQLAPVDRGGLRASVNSRMLIEGSKVVAHVGTNMEYALFVHEGTGLFGPRHRRIRPKRAKVLSFKPRGGRRVFVRSTRGQRPNPFLVRALQLASPWPVTVRR